MRDWKAARIIAKKELTEALRDRKTVVIMVLLPLLLYPLLFLGLSFGMKVQKEKLAAEPMTIMSHWLAAAVCAIVSATRPIRTWAT